RDASRALGSAQPAGDAARAGARIGPVRESQRDRRRNLRPALVAAASDRAAGPDGDRPGDRAGRGCRRGAERPGGVMDPRLLRLYEQELGHFQEMGAEFAREAPKIAARLGMRALTVADPYVERLLEGAAFMAARVQLKLDAEFPRFTQALLDIIYPHYLAPTPSMLIAQLKPDPNDPTLAGGPTV